MDWIRNDDKILQNVKDEVISSVKQNPCLCYCGDIANVSKHFNLKNSRCNQAIDTFTRRAAIKLNKNGQ
jgi:hypothetical protein